MSRKGRITIGLAVMSISSLFSLFGCVDVRHMFGGSTSDDEYLDYQAIGGNAVESQSYEIRRLIRDDVLSEIFFNSSTQSYVAVRTYDVQPRSDKDYLLINKHGVLSDVLTMDGALALNSSGIFFTDEFYVDWLITGDKTRKKYSNVLDMDVLAQSEIDQVIKDADVIDFKKDYHRHKARIFVLKNAQCTVLETSKYFERFNETYVGNYRQATSDLFGSRRADVVSVNRLNFVEPDMGNGCLHLKLEKFQKKGYHRKPFFSHLGYGWEGDYGIGYYQLRFNQENLLFKRFTVKRGDPGDRYSVSADMSHICFPQVQEIATDIAFLSMDGKRAGKLNDVDIGDIPGLYVLRTKLGEKIQALGESADEADLFGDWPENSKKYVWKTTLKGLEADTAGKLFVDYWDGEGDVISHPFDADIALAPRGLPQHISVHWNLTAGNNVDYHLLFNGEVFEWESARGSSSDRSFPLYLYFDISELAELVRNLDTPEAGFNLEFQLQKIDVSSAILSVIFVTDVSRVKLEKIRLKSLGLSYHFDDDEMLKHFEVGRSKLLSESK